MMDSEPSAKQQEWLSLSAHETLSSALKSNIVPNQEYLLQGSILDNGVEVLLHRLRGLCDNVDTGPETFHDHEACFVLAAPPNSGQPTPPLVLRIRRAIDDTTAPWHLRYVSFIE
jgi:mediator of RNA polymerase II transcription subunit 18